MDKPKYMKLQQVFKKAIEGGFTLRGIGASEFYTLLDKYKYESLMSPLFWEAYGKAIGWKRLDQRYGHPDNPQHENILVDDYITYWHRLINHIDGGGTIESFFDQF